MTDTPTTTIDDTEHLTLDDFAQRAYLDYAMYVILDRALPHVGDGLKPVQRRIVYAMSELGLRATAKPKKSARTVGDVLGKFHPHGDSACYEAMVHMAQPFSFRYPLVDGQGNWGSVDDPKSFAAMRYTEAKLARFADLLLGELAQGTVDWVPNFDGTLEEPSVLPARLPHVLINGASGIAVGMATDIPPHNLTEVAAACVHLLDHPKATLTDLMTILPGPDFPTGAEIISPAEDIASMYRTGSGSIRLRAVWERENGDIVVTALPHQVSSAKVLEQIAAQMQAKKLPMVADLRDESDHEDPVRLVIVPRSNRVDLDALMSHLFATTELEKSVRVNLNLIGTDGRPQVKPLTTLLQEWIEFRKDTVRRRLTHRLAQVTDRLHILDGLRIAYLNLDEVIAIIRAEDNPKPVLMARFKLSDIQADAILNMRLRHLARIEEIQIREEQDNLIQERHGLEKTLNSPARLKTLIRKEIEADAESFGDPRRSAMTDRKEARAMTQEDLMPVESLTVILSQKGWVRAAKGHDIDPTGLVFKAGDQFHSAVLARSNQSVAFLGSTGRSYCLAANSLPSARGHGEPLSGRLQMPDGATVVGMVCSKDSARWLLCSDAGYGFIARTSDLITKNRSGKVVLTLPPNALPLPPVPVLDPKIQRLAAVTTDGRLLIFSLTDIPEMPRGKGNKIIGIPSGRARTRDELMIATAVFGIGAQLIVHAGRRHLSLKPGNQDEFLGKRGQRGRKLPKGFRAVTRLEVIEPRQQQLA